MPPLYRLTQGENTLYARDDQHREELLRTGFNGRGKIEVSRFKGLGEMPARYLKATTMDPAQRTLLQVAIREANGTASLADARAPPDGRVAEQAEPSRQQRPAARTTALVETLMGRRPELRFDYYIQKNARFVRDLDL